MMSRASIFAVCAALCASCAAVRAQDIRALEKAVVEVVDRVDDSVVAITRVRQDQPAAALDPEVFRGPFLVPEFRPKPTDPDFIPQEYGTGVVIDRAGLIVTTYHVLGDIKQNDYYVWSRRKAYAATVLAADPWYDLAVLKIDATDLKPIKFGDAKDLKKGQFVIALGNPHAIARDGEASAKWGIVSNLRRAAALPRPRPMITESLHQYRSLIETDARLERGTSGGALVNLDGEMVGLTTTFVSEPLAETSAGLAIPVDEPFEAVLEKLKQGRSPEYGFLGVAPAQDVSPTRRGVVIANTVEGTPAANAGLRSGGVDAITHVNDVPIDDAGDLFMLVGRHPNSKSVQLTIERREEGSRPRTLHKEVTLSKKYIGHLRPAFATVEPPRWRGALIDFATATPAFGDRNQRFNPPVDPSTCVGVADVELDSVAWKADLRPGDFITHVGDKPVRTPEQFHAAVANQTGEVRLRLTVVKTDSSVIRVPAP